MDTTPVRQTASSPRSIVGFGKCGCPFCKALPHVALQKTVTK